MQDQQEPNKTTRSRDRIKIFYDILTSIIRQEDSEGIAKITRVQSDAYLPSDRLRLHLKEMEKLDLIKYQDALSSTSKGREFYSEYKKVAQVLKRFGLV